MKTQNRKLLEGPILISLITLAVPIVLGNVLQSLYQLTDAFWVGRLGGSAVAAVSVSFPIQFLMIAIGGGLAMAGSVLIAQYAGANNQIMVNQVAAQTLLMAMVVSVVLSVIGYIFAPSILNAIGVSPDVFDHALGFMRVSFLGLPFTFIFIMFQSIMRGLGEVKVPMFIVLGTVMLNFLLDPLFIFGWSGIAGHGVMGAAMATFVTQGLSSVIALGVFLGGRYDIHLRAIDFRPDFSFMKKAFRLGLPASIEQSTRAIGMVVMTFLVTGFGTMAIASYGVGSNILMFIIIPALGIAMAVSTLVGQNIGAGNIERATEISRLGAIISFSLLSGIGVLVFMFAQQLVGFFVPGDLGVIELGTVYVRTMALTFGFMGIQMSINGVFRASGNMVTAMTLTLISQWLLQFPLAFVLSKYTSLGVNGLWWAFPVSNVVMALVVIGWYMKGDWKKTKLTKEEKLQERVTEEVLIEEGVRS
ncbi:MATE family efflux transporter [Candidatus Nomurabacteria bacterium]|nr:MATE family efflux transporter [Candidatus Kaiserbacteria bacterium]MCB9814042.1 MATE family efflux transporter [Candidatus Nomurabacteria bacterium]